MKTFPLVIAATVVALFLPTLGAAQTADLPSAQPVRLAQYWPASQPALPFIPGGTAYTSQPPIGQQQPPCGYGGYPPCGNQQQLPPCPQGFKPSFPCTPNTPQPLPPHDGQLNPSPLPHPQPRPLPRTGAGFVLGVLALIGAGIWTMRRSNQRQAITMKKN